MDVVSSVRRRARAVPWATVLPIAVYAVLGLAAYFPTWPGDPARIPQCTCSDAGLNTWFLAATAHAVAHGHDIFFTTALNYPSGVNLTYNAQMPLLGLVVTPLTLTAGPVASLNLLMWLAFPLSATSMFVVLRRWTAWTPAAFVGGLLYGFSPYMAGQSTAHLHLIFVPLPPLMMLAGVELFVRRNGSPRRWGVALGLLAAGQLFISSEILVTTLMVMIVGLVVLAVARPGQIAPALRFASCGLGWALVVAGALLAWPIGVFLAGPEHYVSTSAALQSSPIRADLVGPLVPTSAERFAPAGWVAAGDNLTLFHDSSENGSYLGAPLLLLVIYAVARFWRNWWIRFAALMAVVTFVLALGSRLTIDTHPTAVPLPFALIQRLPLADRLLPSRISLFTALFIAVVVALGLDELHRARSGTPRWQWAGLLLVAVVTAASLVPRWPAPTVRTGLPRYVTSGQIDRIRPGTVVLAYPYPTPLHAQPMVWQAVDGMRFTLVGGYALIPDADGVPTLFPSQLDPAAVQEFLVNEAGGVPFEVSPPVADDEALVVDVRHFLRRYGVGAVLVDESEPNAATVDRLVTRALGRRPVRSGGMDSWYDVQGAAGLVPGPP